MNVVFDTIGGDTLTKSALVLADAGRVVSIVDLAQPQTCLRPGARMQPTISCSPVRTEASSTR
ncbi:MAG: hypothetical protein JNK87_11050 [Bryobacterales bacterium]|nr:hypothetical protein [Bryobacterales bacterium]